MFIIKVVPHDEPIEYVFECNRYVNEWGVEFKGKYLGDMPTDTYQIPPQPQTGTPTPIPPEWNHVLWLYKGDDIDERLVAHLILKEKSVCVYIMSPAGDTIDTIWS